MCVCCLPDEADEHHGAKQAVHGHRTAKVAQVVRQRPGQILHEDSRVNMICVINSSLIVTKPSCNLTSSYHPVVAGNHGANDLNVEVHWNEKRRSN